MQAREVSGFTVRWPFENGTMFRRTDSRTVTGQTAVKSQGNKALRLSGQLSGGVRHPMNSRCLSGSVFPERAAPDTPDRSSKGDGK